MFCHVEATSSSYLQCRLQWFFITSYNRSRSRYLDDAHQWTAMNSAWTWVDAYRFRESCYRKQKVRKKVSSQTRAINKRWKSLFSFSNVKMLKRWMKGKSFPFCFPFMPFLNTKIKWRTADSWILRRKQRYVQELNKEGRKEVCFTVSTACW